MVPRGILAVVVDHIIALNPSHCSILLRAETRARWWCSYWAATGWRVGRAPSNHESGVPWNEGLVVVVSLVFAILCSPWWCIPDGAIDPHWSRRECCFILPRIPPYRHIIDEESVHMNKSSLSPLSKQSFKIYHAYCLIFKCVRTTDSDVLKTCHWCIS